MKPPIPQPRFIKGKSSDAAHQILMQQMRDTLMSPFSFVQLLGPWYQDGLTAALTDEYMTGPGPAAAAAFYVLAPVGGAVLALTVLPTDYTPAIDGSYSVYGTAYDSNTFVESQSARLTVVPGQYDKVMVLETPLEFIAGNEIYMQVSTSADLDPVTNHINAFMLVHWNVLYQGTPSPGDVLTPGADDP